MLPTEMISIISQYVGPDDEHKVLYNGCAIESKNIALRKKCFRDDIFRDLVFNANNLIHSRVICYNLIINFGNNYGIHYSMARHNMITFVEIDGIEGSYSIHYENGSYHIRFQGDGMLQWYCGLYDIVFHDDGWATGINVDIDGMIHFFDTILGVDEPMRW